MPLIRYLVVGRLLWRGIRALSVRLGLVRWPAYRQVLDDEEMGVLMFDAMAWGTAIAHAVLAGATAC